MPRKAQAEIALILGLVVIAIIIGIYSYSSLTQTSYEQVFIGDEQKEVEAYVRDLLETLSTDAMLTVYNQGGYYDTSGMASAELLGNRVAYWQLCGEADDLIPDVKSNLEQGISERLMEVLPEGPIVIAGRQVEFTTQQLDIHVNINDEDVVVNINLPVTIDGVSMPPGYTIDIGSNLGEILKFSKDFSKTQADYRILDKNLIKIINRSNPESGDYGYCWLPTEGIVQSYTFRKSWGELKDCMEEHILHTLTHTYEWQRPQTRDDGTISDEMLSFSFIPQIYKYDEGRWGQYVDLDLDFTFANGGDSLQRDNPMLLFSTHPDPVKFNAVIPFPPPVTKYDVSYDVAFPVVVSVMDDKLDAYFRFANFVNIAGSVPSEDCDFDFSEEWQDTCNTQVTDYNSKITVTDFNDNPLHFVEATFGVCDFGLSGQDGVIERKLPDMEDATLELVLKGDSGDEDFYSECVSTTELRDSNYKVIRMPRYKTYDLEYVPVTLTRANPDSPLQVSGFGASLADKVTLSLSTITKDDCMSSLSFVHYNYEWEETTEGDIVEYIVNHGEIRIPASSVYNATLLMGETEIFDDELTIDYGKDDIYIYVPNILGTATDGEIKDVLEDCMEGPVSQTKPSEVTIGCVGGL